jgi:hypothetical protein
MKCSAEKRDVEYSRLVLVLTPARESLRAIGGGYATVSVYV